MINQKQNYAAWALLLDDLVDAREHLEKLIEEMSHADDEYGEIEFRIALGHIYSHLNRAWNRRDCRDDLLTDEHSKHSANSPTISSRFEWTPAPSFAATPPC